MSKESKEIYEFGPFRLDVGEHLFQRTDGAQSVSLPEKAFQTLVILLRNQGRLVTKAELLDAVWPDSFVEENNLDKAIHAIRHALSEKPAEHKYVETVRKHGYRFIAEVKGSDVAISDRPGIVGAPAFAVGASDAISRSVLEIYQQARNRYQQMTAPATLGARSLVAEALQLNPTFIPAHCLSAELTTLEVIVGLKWPEAGFAEARASIAKARELGADSADYYSAAAYVDLIADWDFAAAEEKLRKALTKNIHHGPANRMLAETFMFQGRHEEAAVYVQRAQSETGLHTANILAISRFLARDYPAVIKTCEEMLALSPGHMIPAWTKCWALEQMGRFDEAFAGYEDILKQPYGEPVLRWIGYAYAVAGNRSRALDTAARLEAASKKHNLSPTHLAAIYSGLGEFERAVPYIEQGLEMRDPFMLWIVADPRFDNLRGNTRFKEIVQCVLEKSTPTAGKSVVESAAQAKNLSTALPKSKITASGQHALVELSDWRELVERLDAQSELETTSESDVGSTDSFNLGEHPAQQRSNTSIRWMPLAGLFVVLGIAAFLGAKLWQNNSPNSSASFTEKRLTVEGGVTRVTISRDGRYAAAVQNAALVLFDLKNETDRILVSAAKDTRIMAIAFHPTNSDVYYGTRHVDNSLVTLYKMPIGGGEPTKILDDIYGSLTFSPDGVKFVFLRRYPELNEYAMLVADSDGSNIDRIASSQPPNRFDGTPVWSPDGDKIACAAISTEGGFHFTLAKIDVATGALRYVPQLRWTGLSSPIWLANSIEIVFAGQAENSINAQIWRINTDTGDLTRLTNDQFHHESISGTADGKSIVAVKVRQRSHVWMLGDTNAQLTAGLDNNDGTSGLAFASDGSIFYSSRADGRDAIWRMKQDGSDAAEIVPDTGGGLAVSPDGRLLVFQGKQSADHLGLQVKNIVDGSEVALTQGVTAQSPSFFPDGKRVAFSIYDKKLTLHEMSIDSGQSRMLTDEFRAAMAPMVSPSGRYVAFAFSRAQPGITQVGIAVFDNVSKKVTTSHPVKITTGSIYEEPTVHWSADESEVYFIQLDNSVSNLMRLKLGDGSISNFTNFPDGRIFNFAVEPNGTRILVARGQVERDAVLLRSAE